MDLYNLFFILILCNGILLNLLNMDLNCVLKYSFLISFSLFLAGWWVDGSHVNGSCCNNQPKIMCWLVGTGSLGNPTGQVSFGIFFFDPAGQGSGSCYHLK